MHSTTLATCKSPCLVWLLLLLLLLVSLVNILTVFGLTAPNSVKVSPTCSAVVNSGGRLKKCRMLQGGIMRFLVAMLGVRKRLFLQAEKSSNTLE